VTALTFLGTGNYLAQGRWWNSFVVDRSVLVEPSPSCLPQLRRAGLRASELDVVVISHFHPDHTYGWPFLVLELIVDDRGGRPLHVVGPPGVQAFLDDMMRLGSVTELTEELAALAQVHYVEVDGTWQEAGDLRLRAVEVDHVPDLRCFGFLFDRGDRTVAYSGDTKPCAGLDELAASTDVLVLECNGPHPAKSHMDVGSVASLHERFPDVRILLTHVGDDVVAPDGVEQPADLDVVEL
jgi:ribonuclease BN (tRNA processing enzyme)